MSSETTKYQINFKTHKDGTLINLYADTIKELEVQITDIAMIAQLIKTTERELFTSPQGATPPQEQHMSVEQVAQSFGATPTSLTGTSPVTCKHGNMVYREGVNAQGKAWKGHMCPAPRNAADKCDAIWVR